MCVILINDLNIIIDFYFAGYRIVNIVCYCYTSFNLMQIYVREALNVSSSRTDSELIAAVIC